MQLFTDAIRKHSVTSTPLPINRARETRLSSAALRRHQLKMSLKQGRPPPAPSSGAAGVQINMSAQGLSVSDKMTKNLKSNDFERNNFTKNIYFVYA